jgi:membrane-associated HD superfamily phosphohydrolase
LNVIFLAATGLYVTYTANRHLVPIFSGRELALHIVSLVPAVCAGKLISLMMDPLFYAADFTFRTKALHATAAILAAATSLLIYRHTSRMLLGTRVDD